MIIKTDEPTCTFNLKLSVDEINIIEYALEAYRDKTLPGYKDSPIPGITIQEIQKWCDRSVFSLYLARADRPF